MTWKHERVYFKLVATSYDTDEDYVLWSELDDTFITVFNSRDKLLKVPCI